MPGKRTHPPAWKIVSGKAPGSGFSELTQYLDEHVEDGDLPFVIFSDRIPEAEELSSVLEAERKFDDTHRSCVLALRKNSNRDTQACWRLLAMGIDDVVDWEDELEMRNFLESRASRNREIREILQSSLVSENLIGESACWRNFLSELIEVSIHSQTSLLLIGESGTGKELISRLVHTLDKRPAKKKLIVVDCTTIAPELSGSELFGHERGSYTSAVQSRDGAVALADGGTLFLDEVGELPLNLQSEFLRVLQEGTFKRIGSNTWQKANFRLVCATNRDLRKAVEEGHFRQDLYFRIAGCECRVPSLEERKEDIPLLVRHFLSSLFPENECPDIDRLVMDFLQQRNYPGNVRELKQVVHRIACKHVPHRSITIGEIPAADRALLCPPDENLFASDGMQGIIRKALLGGEDWWKLKNRISETAIQVALELESNNKAQAAARLGVDVRTVQQYMRQRNGRGR